MADRAFQVRIDDETHRRWRVKAADLGYRSVADLVRAAVELHDALDATRGRIPVHPVRESARAAEFTPETCPARAKHKAGVYCKVCDATIGGAKS